MEKHSPNTARLSLTDWAAVFSAEFSAGAIGDATAAATSAKAIKTCDGEKRDAKGKINKKSISRGGDTASTRIFVVDADRVHRSACTSDERGPRTAENRPSAAAIGQHLP